MVALNYELDAELHRRMKVAAATAGLTLKAWLLAAIAAAIAEQESWASK